MSPFQKPESPPEFWSTGIPVSSGFTSTPTEAIYEYYVTQTTFLYVLYGVQYLLEISLSVKPYDIRYDIVWLVGCEDSYYRSQLLTQNGVHPQYAMTRMPVVHSMCNFPISSRLGTTFWCPMTGITAYGHTETRNFGQKYEQQC
jgi:predicted RNA-binding Zn-ribbon protein involved in translation (DUF1610 family)